MQHEHAVTYLLYLPMELHLRIRHKLMTDPGTTIKQLRSLRLVCKLFYNVWSPIVLLNMSLFKGDPIDHVNRLLDLVRDNGTTAAFTTTLTLRNWELLEFHWPFWKRKNHGHRSLGFMETLSYIRARHSVSLLPDKLQLPSLRCLRLSFPSFESNWATYQLTRMLSALPQLTELELATVENVSMVYAAQCSRHLRGLRKLKLIFMHDWKRQDFPDPEIDCLSCLIANNNDLTHLTIPYAHKLIDLQRLFLDVPSNRPLILEHVSCGSNCRNFEALLPHIKSLSSFEFQSGYTDAANTWCTTLSDAGIFPPTIKVPHLDPPLTIYLKKHPGIVGFSLVGEGYTIPVIERDELCSILAQNSATLQYLRITSLNLAPIFQTFQNEFNFKRCKNLREIVLNGRYDAFYPLKFVPRVRDKAYYEKQVLPALAHINCSLTVVLQDVQVEIFDACVEFCRKSDDPFVCDLAGRLVFEPFAA